MTKTVLPKAPTEREGRSIYDQEPGNDWLLARVIAYADNYRIEQSITLFCSGVVISGIVISGREYFNYLADSMRGFDVLGVKSESDGAALSQIMSKAYRQFEDQYPPFDPEGDDLPRVPTYILLCDARIVQPGQSASPPGGMLWRGKIAAVDGVTLTKLD